jgi:uncharacterized Zn finger protein (UPF0148 family)
MSMGFKQCDMCGDGEAEALYAVDGMIEWFCPECNARWAVESTEYEQVSAHQHWMMRHYGEE